MPWTCKGLSIFYHQTSPPPLLIPLQSVINAELNKTFTEPIALAGVINATVNTPDLPEGRVEVGPLEVVGPPGEPSPTERQEVSLQGVIDSVRLEAGVDLPIIRLAAVVDAVGGGGGSGGGRQRDSVSSAVFFCEFFSNNSGYIFFGEFRRSRLVGTAER